MWIELYSLSKRYSGTKNYSDTCKFCHYNITTYWNSFIMHHIICYWYLSNTQCQFSPWFVSPQVILQNLIWLDQKLFGHTEIVQGSTFFWTFVACNYSFKASDHAINQFMAKTKPNNISVHQQDILGLLLISWIFNTLKPVHYFPRMFNRVQVRTLYEPFKY